MISYQSLSKRPKFLILAFIAICLGMSIAVSTSAFYTSIKTQEKIIEKERTTIYEPIELVEIKTKQKVVKLGEKFKEDDWLRGLSFKIRNAFDKDIVYISLDLDFPDTEEAEIMMAFPIELGRKPEDEGVFGEPLRVKPNEIFTLSIDESTYERLRKFIEKKQSIGSIKKVKLRVGFIIFDDATAWGAGNFYRQNPNNPKHYINVGVKPPTK